MSIRLSDHPTVRALRDRTPDQTHAPQQRLDAAWLKQLCRNAGADDVGFVEVDRSALADQRDQIAAVFAPTRTLIAIVCRMNRDPVRSPVRSVANHEFHITYDETNTVARRIARRLDDQGIRAVNAVAAFPMETQNFPGRTWTVAHKPVAEAAGLGHMGIHRNVIHPRFGNFILLGTILIDREVSAYDHPIDYNPCLECKLCVAACPVGAISPDGDLNFFACYTHNYREFLGGFNDWVNELADAKSADDYRKKVSVGETVSMWQSLSFKANYKAAYCISVCPAGEEVIAPFLDDRKKFIADTVRPLTEKPETVYVIAGSDAEEVVGKRFPAKTAKRVSASIPLTSIEQFLSGLPLRFQPRRAKDLNAVYHMTFTGREAAQATVTIAGAKMKIERGLVGKADVALVADTSVWLQFLMRKYSIKRAILMRKVRIKGDLELFKRFGRCFA